VCIEFRGLHIDPADIYISNALKFPEILGTGEKQRKSKIPAKGKQSGKELQELQARNQRLEKAYEHYKDWKLKIHYGI
jgi:hypothetical protein